MALPDADGNRKGGVMNVLVVLTSHDQLGNTGRPTGFWLEELAAPYYRLKQAARGTTDRSQLPNSPSDALTVAVEPGPAGRVPAYSVAPPRGDRETGARGDQDPAVRRR